VKLCVMFNSKDFHTRFVFFESTFGFSGAVLLCPDCVIRL
jgi:hypothetical protein